MEPYRKKVNLPSDKDYWFVHLGPIVDTPEWHQELYANQCYAFPTQAAAELFALNHMTEGRRVFVKQGE